MLETYVVIVLLCLERWGIEASGEGETGVISVLKLSCVIPVFLVCFAIYVIVLV